MHRLSRAIYTGKGTTRQTETTEAASLLHCMLHNKRRGAAARSLDRLPCCCSLNMLVSGNAEMRPKLLLYGTYTAGACPNKNPLQGEGPGSAFKVTTK